MSKYNYTYTIPSGMSIDTSKLTPASYTITGNATITSVNTITWTYEREEYITYSNKDGVIFSYNLDTFKLLIWMKLI